MNSRHQFVQFNIYGEGENGVYEDVEKIDGAFLDRWFESPAPSSGAAAESPSGRLHKVDDYWELTLQGDRLVRRAMHCGLSLLVDGIDIGTFRDQEFHRLQTFLLRTS